MNRLKIIKFKIYKICQMKNIKAMIYQQMVFINHYNKYLYNMIKYLIIINNFNSNKIIITKINKMEIKIIIKLKKTNKINQMMMKKMMIIYCLIIL